MVDLVAWAATTNLGMLSIMQWCILGVASATTFLCYHAIPASLHRSRSEPVAAAAKSGLFTAFVRVCGNDYIIMPGCMLALATGLSGPGGWAAWVMVVHASWVASVSFRSAWAIAHLLRIKKE